MGVRLLNRSRAAARCFSFALKGSEVKHVELDMELAVSIFLEVISKYRS